MKKELNLDTVYHQEHRFNTNKTKKMMNLKDVEKLDFQESKKL